MLGSAPMLTMSGCQRRWMVLPSMMAAQFLRTASAPRVGVAVPALKIVAGFRWAAKALGSWLSTGWAKVSSRVQTGAFAGGWFGWGLGLCQGWRVERVDARASRSVFFMAGSRPSSLVCEVWRNLQETLAIDVRARAEWSDRLKIAASGAIRVWPIRRGPCVGEIHGSVPVAYPGAVDGG